MNTRFQEEKKRQDRNDVLMDIVKTVHTNDDIDEIISKACSRLCSRLCGDAAMTLLPGRGGLLSRCALRPRISVHDRPVDK